MKLYFSDLRLLDLRFKTKPFITHDRSPMDFGVIFCSTNLINDHQLINTPKFKVIDRA